MSPIFPVEIVRSNLNKTRFVLLPDGTGQHLQAPFCWHERQSEEDRREGQECHLVGASWVKKSEVANMHNT